MPNQSYNVLLVQLQIQVAVLISLLALTLATPVEDVIDPDVVVIVDVGEDSVVNTPAYILSTTDLPATTLPPPAT